MTWRITPLAAGETIELVVHGPIGDFGVASGDVVKALLQYPRAREIRAYINSPGGDAFAGQAIYAALHRHQAKVRVEVEGMAASAASLIAMAGDTIRVAQGGMIMIHDPWAMAIGAAGEFRKMADDLDRLRLSMRDVYAARTGRDPAEVEAAMTAETWYSAEDAVAFGLATEVLPAKRAAASVVPAQMAARFRNMPEMIRAADVPPVRDAARPGPVAADIDKRLARIKARIAEQIARRLGA